MGKGGDEEEGKGDEEEVRRKGMKKGKTLKGKMAEKKN